MYKRFYTSKKFCLQTSSVIDYQQEHFHLMQSQLMICSLIVLSSCRAFCYQELLLLRLCTKSLELISYLIKYSATAVNNSVGRVFLDNDITFAFCIDTKREKSAIKYSNISLHIQ